MPTVTVGDTDIVYHQSGEGPDIVWISGGGGNGSSWRLFQTPAFDDAYRSTSFANRGVAETVCRAPLPWTVEDLARDTAALIEAVCDPPVVSGTLTRAWPLPVELAANVPRSPLRVVSQKMATLSPLRKPEHETVTRDPTRCVVGETEQTGLAATIGAEVGVRVGVLVAVG